MKCAVLEIENRPRSISTVRLSSILARPPLLSLFEMLTPKPRPTPTSVMPNTRTSTLANPLIPRSTSPDARVDDRPDVDVEGADEAERGAAQHHLAADLHVEVAVGVQEDRAAEGGEAEEVDAGVRGEVPRAAVVHVDGEPGVELEHLEEFDVARDVEQERMRPQAELRAARRVEPERAAGVDREDAERVLRGGVDGQLHGEARLLEADEGAAGGRNFSGPRSKPSANSSCSPVALTVRSKVPEPSRRAARWSRRGATAGPGPPSRCR